MADDRYTVQRSTTIAAPPARVYAGVTWTLTGKQTLATRVMGVFKSMDSLVGPDFEKGLARLKATAEA
jgi:hypothetical protein